MEQHSEIKKIARRMYNDPDGRRLLNYIMEEICGVGRKMGGIDAQAMALNVGQHNVGVEIGEMLKEPKHENNK